MNNASIAPCGVNCDTCIGFQRDKNRCAGCNSTGNKPYHCTVCSIKMCEHKSGDEKTLCNQCDMFPCRRIKDLDKRYRTKYRVSLIENLNTIKDIGLTQFIELEEGKWTCSSCGQLLCVHRDTCLNCGKLKLSP